MVGEQLTFVDFSVFELLDHMNFCSHGKTFSKYENLQRFFSRMQQLDGFKEFWADCPKASFKPWIAVFNN